MQMLPIIKKMPPLHILFTWLSKFLPTLSSPKSTSCHIQWVGGFDQLWVVDFNELWVVDFNELSSPSNTHAKHANFIDPTGAPAEGGRPCLVYCIGMFSLCVTWAT